MIMLLKRGQCFNFLVGNSNLFIGYFYDSFFFELLEDIFYVFMWKFSFNVVSSYT